MNDCKPPRRLAHWAAALLKLSRRPRLWIGGILLGLIASGAVVAAPHLRAWYHFRAARSALEHYHNPQAIRHLQICLHAWPTDVEVMLMCVRASRRAGAYEDAQRGLGKYRRLHGRNESGALEPLLLSAECGLHEAEEACRRHIEEGHAAAPLFFEALARGYLRQYRLADARGCLDLWLKQQPDNPQALCLKGRFHLDYAHELPLAVESYRRAVEIDADNEEARLGLALALWYSKNFTEEAIPHFEWLLSRQPDNLHLQVGLAECRRAVGEEAEALRLLDGVLSRQPDYAPALALRGRLALENGRWEEAESCLRQAVAGNPSDHQACYRLLQCLRHNGKEDEAQTREQQLAQWEADAQRFDELVRHDMSQRPQDPALHCTLGQLLLRRGHRQEGLRWLNSALRLDPDYAPARQALMEYHQQNH